MNLRCYRCGESLAKLSLPLSRLDTCPACSVELHACRMCAHYLPTAADGCTEDDAQPVQDKTRANFCDYFTPSPDAFDEQLRTADERARDELATLFGEGGPDPKQRADPTASDTTTSEQDALREQANALFKN
jgi:hypothetical protein